MLIYSKAGETICASDRGQSVQSVHTKIFFTLINFLIDSIEHCKVWETKNLQMNRQEQRKWDLNWKPGKNILLLCVF